ncbi:endocuticle structural glycoprotein SgAbd-2-like [Coccinella septempunctata]|uniref:endocuticle structural glycoprotein SgAbd-2-like n=1 Tax=Coccinella septempunctata TaxID=41139 RepID=UPI001D099805|nr:endocuticle structural glycoprotein SgAbd-2-like [Coccinella septempunctata]
MRHLIIVSVFVAFAFGQNYQARRSPQPFQPRRQEQNNQLDNEENSEQYQNEDNNRQQYHSQVKSEPNERIRTTTFIPIIRFDKEQGTDGSYKASWETGNDIFTEEEGYLKNLGPDPDNEGQNLNAQVQQGSYSYTSPDGQNITVHYYADETGFHPSGDHLPTPPPVSPEVQKGLDLIYEGIRAQQEAAEREARENPNSQNVKQYEDNGQYRQQ